jgi:MtN3 and saliva related transmembrane protein
LINNYWKLNLDNFIGFIAAICTTVSFVPQAIKIHKTKKTNDISLGMFILMSTGVALWIAYGFLIASAPVIVANAVTLMLAAYILVMKVRLE